MLESIGQLAAGIAHAINTPTQFIGDNSRFVRESFAALNPLFAALDTLLKAVEKEAVTSVLIAEVQNVRQTADLEYAAAEIPKALEGVERVSRIVRAMKDFSHPRSESKTLLDLNKAIESTVTICRNEWKYVAELILDLDPNLPHVPALPGELIQALLNIMINATHSIADVVGAGHAGKGRITVSTLLLGDWAEFRVRDTGTGVPEKARDRVFDPFFTTKAVGKGTGQGLAIARSVVIEKHGSELRFETEICQGTTFVIRLPLSSNGDRIEPKQTQ